MCEASIDARPGVESRAEARSRWAVLNAPMIWVILAYKATLSPFLGGHCRFDPTCSTYALEVCRRHNPVRAAGLVCWRLLRCQPFGGKGWDPVPEHRGR